MKKALRSIRAHVPMGRVRSWSDVRLWFRIYGRDVWLFITTLLVFVTLAAYGMQQREVDRQARGLADTARIAAAQSHATCVARQSAVPIFTQLLVVVNRAARHLGADPVATREQIREYAQARPKRCD